MLLIARISQLEAVAALAGDNALNAVDGQSVDAVMMELGRL